MAYWQIRNSLIYALIEVDRKITGNKIESCERAHGSNSNMYAVHIHTQVVCVLDKRW